MKNRYKDRIATIISEPDRDDFLYSTDIISKIVKMFEKTGADFLYGDGLYDESYKIAADSDFLFRYLYEANLKVEYMKEYIVRMRMGGLSTDSKRRKQMWEEDIRMYRSHGLNPTLTKLEKMAWKVPQFISAKSKSFG